MDGVRSFEPHITTGTSHQHRTTFQHTNSLTSNSTHSHTLSIIQDQEPLVAVAVAPEYDQTTYTSDSPTFSDCSSTVFSVALDAPSFDIASNIYSAAIEDSTPQNNKKDAEPKVNDKEKSKEKDVVIVKDSNLDHSVDESLLTTTSVLSNWQRDKQLASSLVDSVQTGLRKVRRLLLFRTFTLFDS
jgi:hypothetical protein